MVMNTPACSQAFISVEVYSASTPLPLLVVETSMWYFHLHLQNEGVAEIILAVPVSVTLQIKVRFLVQVLKSGEVAYITT